MSPELTIAADMVIRQRSGSVTRHVGDEFVILTPENYTLHIFNEIGARIWALSKNPISIDDMVNVLMEEYNIDEDQIKSDVVDFVDELAKKNILDIKRG